MTPTEAIHLLAINAGQAGRTDEAIALLREVVRLEPDSAVAWHNLGVALLKNAAVDGAIAAHRRSLELNPGVAETHHHLGIALVAKRLFDEAKACFVRAIALKPDLAAAHWNYAVELLTRGDFERGWREFEWRLEVAPARLKRNFSQPRWTGQDPRGRTILLHVEGGFGDAIQFVRYAPMVAERGANVILECPSELVGLFKPVRGVSAIFSRGESLPAFDWHSPLQSLPLMFGTTLTMIPAHVPYLSAPPDLIAHWATRMRHDSSFKVGLTWAGSVADNLRSRSLGLFAPLAAILGGTFYGLQTGPEANQPAPPSMRLIKLGAELKDFAETAAVISNLDLVISVDTSIAHLAGALARRVWTLIPSSPDFRWLRDRPDSPWYPTMRLFRQQPGEHWNKVVERLAADLQQRVASTET